MKTRNLLPDTIVKNMVIRTGSYAGTGRNTRAIDTTEEVISQLNEAGWAAIPGNDAPRGGVGGNYVKVIGRLWTKQTLRKHVSGAIATGDDIYRGAGVYRLAIADGKVVASLYEGYHGSCKSAMCTLNAWAEEAERQMCKFGAVIKADGSGCSFFVREGYLDEARAAGLDIDTYGVPSVYGGQAVNHEIK